MRRFVTVGLVVLSAALSTGAAIPRAQLCDVAQQPRPLPAAIHESSGVAASRRSPGVYWTHNDSKAPYLFAVDRTGKMLAQVRLAGAPAGDMEDVQLAPCGAGDCLYLADIGDNQASRREIAVYRVPEPALGATQTAPPVRFAARYPDGPQDAEALFVLPGGRIFVVTKGETGPIAVYRFPAAAAPGATAVLERVRVLEAKKVKREERVTGGSASPNGRWVALRTLRSLSIYPAAVLLGGGKEEPWKMDLTTLHEPQGEGVSLADDGSIVLTSEGGKKKSESPTLSRLKCTF
jgi:hypothetical protein